MVLELTNKNEATTLKKYQMNGFDPKTESRYFSYTSAKVADTKYFNRYIKSSEHKVFGYYTNYSQYDGRNENLYSDGNCGRNVNMSGFIGIDSYDEIVYGFFGINGDKGEKSAQIAQQASIVGASEFELTSTDTWADLLAYRNNGQNAPNPEQNAASIWHKGKDAAYGTIGGFTLWKKRNSKLQCSISIGGWSMSEIFHRLAADRANSKLFVDSLMHFLNRFSIFDGVDIDWEYPGSAGNGNMFGPDDGKNFGELLKLIREKIPNVKISVAVSADVNTMSSSDLPAIDSYVDFYNVMTYDFFGGSYSQKLGHHTNLRSPDTRVNSIKRSVDFLEKIGISLKKINIGYASYSRNAIVERLEQESPLNGDVSISRQIFGTFGAGVTEWYDILHNYLEVDESEGLRGKNGWKLVNDVDSRAQYLYNKEISAFMSIETPLSVYWKARFVKNRGLHGLFTWVIDYDNGLLVNAAHEGFGHEAYHQKINMEPFYKIGGVDQRTLEP